MSNIDRRYSYHDDGVLPSEGEYGVTYLTLYSSGAGNVYDGWMWDPDQIHSSETERTFGYRNPDYPDYCWDDEVVVDLSNAQTRQETSDFAQGRITSFNTNVSNQPILLQDIDITGLNEEEREAKATTVLFSAIPLIKDAYIHAEVEIQAKMNISPDNTTGTVRMEAFYIINNESDRTMRPNPVDHRAVCTTDERNTFRFLYWNPALKHEDHNYIGVKLLCTGGTAEIGISDDPEYGDAIITLTSAGLTGDHIDEGRPVSLEIYGKSLVPAGYRIKEDDYTVLVTYDTGEVYDVSRICTYSPVMGTKIVDPTTTLTAHYQGLSASMTITLTLVESIQLIGLTDIYEDYTLSLDDYTVLAFYENGDVMDITYDEEVTYSPAVGTVISSDITLTATYAPSYIPGSTFQDSLQLTKHSEVATGYFYDDGLHYTSYNDGMIVITGNAERDHGGRVYDKWYGVRECIRIPSNIESNLPSRQFDYPTIANNRYCKFKWKANGAISGFDDFAPFVLDMIGFDDVEIKPMLYKVEQLVEDPEAINHIYFGLAKRQPYLTSEMLKVYGNASFISDFDSNPAMPCTGWGLSSRDMEQLFAYDRALTHVNFLSNWDTSQFRNIGMLFYNCLNLNDISGLTNWNVTNAEVGNAVFYGCENLRSAGALYKWRLINCQGIAMWFKNSGLRHVQGLGNLSVGSNLEQQEGYGISFNETFSGCTALTDLTGLENLINYENPSTKRPIRLDYTFYGCTNLENIGAVASWNTSNVESIICIFSGCTKLKNISPASGWRTDILKNINAAFFGCDYADITVFSSWVLDACTVFYDTFGVNGSPPPLSVVPGTKDGSGLSLAVPYEKYQNSELTFSNFFRTYNPYSDVQNVVFFNYYPYNRRPAYPGVPERYMIYYADSGLFEGLDIFWIESNTSVTSGIVSGTVVMHYVYSDRLPTWYKQMEMDAYKDYFDRYQYRNYDASGVVFSYT